MSKDAETELARPGCGDIVLAGIGRDGAAIVNGIDGLPPAARKLFLTGSPTRSISESQALIQIRTEPEKGSWRDELGAALAGSRMLVAIAATTGRESGFAPEVIALAQSRGALTVAVLVEPLLGASPHRNEAMKHLLRELTRRADATIPVSAEPRPPALLSIGEAMERWTGRLSAAIRGLLGAAAAEDAVGLDFGDVKAVLSQHCRATVGSGRGQTVGDALRDAADQSLAPAGELGTARSVLAHLVVGGKTPLDDARHAASALELLFQKAEIRCGVSVEEELGEIRATIVAGKLDAGAAGADENAWQTAHAKSSIFGAGDPAVYEGENLDIPAFVRRGITLPGNLPRPTPEQTTLFG